MRGAQGGEPTHDGPLAPVPESVGRGRPARTLSVAGETPTPRRRRVWAAAASLAAAAARGDPKAKRDLLSVAAPVACRTVRHLLKDPQDEEDAVQSTLLAVLASAARFRGHASLEHWVSRIAFRTTLRLAQKQRALVPTDMLDVLPAPSREGMSDDIPRPIEEYLQRLPPPQREALVLRYALGYSVSDVADATASPCDTVKYRLKGALAKLRRLIGRDLAWDRTSRLARSVGARDPQLTGAFGNRPSKSRPAQRVQERTHRQPRDRAAAGSHRQGRPHVGAEVGMASSSGRLDLADLRVRVRSRGLPSVHQPVC
jgi:RNA polymerase sigma-70 factor (ECF subfamily)